jgi:hypothetical protein
MIDMARLAVALRMGADEFIVTIGRFAVNCVTLKRKERQFAEDFEGKINHESNE